MGGGRLVLVLGLVKDYYGRRGYGYDVDESDQITLHGGCGVGVFNTTTTEKGGGYRPPSPLLEAYKLRTTLTTTKMMKLQ